MGLGCDAGWDSDATLTSVRESGVRVIFVMNPTKKNADPGFASAIAQLTCDFDVDVNQDITLRPAGARP